MPKISTCPFLEAVARYLMWSVEPKSHAGKKVAGLNAVELAERRHYEALDRDRQRERSARYRSKPGVAERERQARRERRQDPEYRERERQARRERRKDPEYRERELQAERERRKDPEYRERERQARRESRRKNLEDPEYRERERQAGRKHDKKRSKDPEYRERKRQTSREWYANNPEKARANKAARRARKAGNADTPHPDEDRWAVDPTHHTDATECYWCGVELGDDCHIDHVIPIALGGRDIPTNLVRSCPTCNRSKNAKHPDDWADEITGPSDD